VTQPRAADELWKEVMDQVCPFKGKRPPLEMLRSRDAKLPLTWCKANLTDADLTGAALSNANLSAADLTGANLSKANLREANLRLANLTRANLSKANLSFADLWAASFPDANLTGADLLGTNLTAAYLFKANLTGAIINGTNLTGANVDRADFTAALFEPRIESTVTVYRIETVRGLSQLSFGFSPSSLIELRKRFADSGMREQERAVTFAKLRTQRQHSWQAGAFWRKVEAGFSLVAFELPCGYGLNYGRPLHILFFVLIPVLAVVYALVLRKQSGAGLWRVWSPDRIRTDEGQSAPERLYWSTPRWPGGPQGTGCHTFFRALGFGFLFSLLSAFQIGWRELNVGNWITRLLPREYTIRATGWVRVVSGAQSLVSVYLLALWALTYFGRPFE
jgi:hypothetical protein